MCFAIDNIQLSLCKYFVYFEYIIERTEALLFLNSLLMFEQTVYNING